jgi:hypothetical protein
MSQLNLSSRAAVLKGGQKGPALIPGNAVASLLYRRVTGQDQPQMPLGGKLSPAEIATIEKWIDEGAPWDDAAVSTAAPTTPAPSREKVFLEQDYNWWALRRPVRPPVPQAADPRWNANPIHAFLKKALDEKGREVAPPADPKRLYGLDQEITQPFGRQCLMARRLVERGVRIIQLWSGAYVNDTLDTWDAHNSIVDNHGQHAAEVDKPIAGLLTDLKRRGMLDETLVVWHTEFGRMPVSQRGVGRDHNPNAFSIWMAGGGIPGGQVIGQIDDFGYKVTTQPVSVFDFHATILDLLGLDHKRLTYFFNGRHMRLTDVHGELIPQIAA